MKLSQDELRTIAIALNIAIDGFHGQGPINTAPMVMLRYRVRNLLRAASDEGSRAYFEQCAAGFDPSKK